MKRNLSPANVIRRLPVYVSSFVRTATCANRYLENWPTVVVDWCRIFLGGAAHNDRLQLRTGDILSLHPRTRGLLAVFVEIFGSKVYEPDARFAIRENDVVVDIGAHIGMFSLHAAGRARSGRIVACEPFTPHFALLAQNVRQNHLDRITPLHLGVSDQPGKLEMFYTVGSEPDNTSLFTGSIAGARRESIDVVSLEGLFESQKIERCDLLKIDCEGAEYKIFDGASSAVFARINRVAMEWHRFLPEHDPNLLAERLRQEGFSVLDGTIHGGMAGYLYVTA